MQLDDVRTVLVVGAGQMGRGIAEVCAATGFEVLLADKTSTLASAGYQQLVQGLERRVAKAELTKAELDTWLARIRTLALDAVQVGDVAIEAVSEDFELKRSVFEWLDRTLPDESRLLSNTSSNSITRLARATRRPDRVMGMHFMNPVPKMALVELVRGADTSENTVALVSSLAERLGKITVLSQDRPGFIVNRVLIPFLNEACLALGEGVASVSDIDLGVHLGLNHPMGPLALADLIGLDTVLAIARVLHTEFADEKYRPAPLLERLVAEGQLGRKSGRGFYDHGTRPATPLAFSGQSRSGSVRGEL